MQETDAEIKKQKKGKLENESKLTETSLTYRGHLIATSYKRISYCATPLSAKITGVWDFT